MEKEKVKSSYFFSCIILSDSIIRSQFLVYVSIIVMLLNGFHAFAGYQRKHSLTIW